MSSFDPETEDIDWFAVDPSGRIAHFATGGNGFLPSNLRPSLAELQRVRRLFRGLPVIGLGIPSPLVANHVHFRNAQERERYLSDFMSLAARGLFSFDSNIERKSNAEQLYHLVASPSKALTIGDLPSDDTYMGLLARLSRDLECTSVIRPSDVA